MKAQGQSPNTQNSHNTQMFNKPTERGNVEIRGSLGFEGYEHGYRFSDSLRLGGIW